MIKLINHKSLISNISILKMNIEISTKKEIIKMLKQTTKEMNIYPQIKELEDIYRNYNIIGRSNK